MSEATLRWTPGPDELRLPSCEEEQEPLPLNTRQIVAIVDGLDCLQRHLRGRRDAFVGSDQVVYWDPAYHVRPDWERRPVAPELYVAFGVASRQRSSYVVWEEGKPPDFVLDVAPPWRLSEEDEDKRDAYAKMGVPECFLYRPEETPAPTLEGFELRDGSYEPLPEETLPAGAAGVRSKALGLCLCMRPPSAEPLDAALRWYDPATGSFLPSRHELAADKQQAEARAVAAEAKVAELTALIEEMRRG